MPISLGALPLAKNSLGAISITKWGLGTIPIYSAGNTVTYHVDIDVEYQEEVDANKTVLAPITFIPSKEGWEFVGWRLDDTASADVLDSLFMDGDPITLYGVFKQKVTVTYYNGDVTEQKVTGYKYYNNGSTVNPMFTIEPVTINEFSFRGWSISPIGNADIDYYTINNTQFSTDIILYGLYQQTITLSYNANGGSGSINAQTDIRYYSSAETYINPSFILQPNSFTRSGYFFSKWAMSSANGTQYNVGASVTLTASTVFYAVWMSSTLTVFSKSAESATPAVYNTSYVSLNSGFNNGSCVVSKWYQTGTATATGTVTIKPQAPYTKATITLKCHSVNVIQGDNGKWGKATISGSFGYATRQNNNPAWTSDTADFAASATGTSLSLTVDASTNNPATSTWTGFGVWISSIVLS